MKDDPHGLKRPRAPELVPEFIKAIPTRHDDSIAVFDADGTLWVDDVADDFTQWMMEQGHISNELWPQYMRVYRDDPPTGCRFLLTLYHDMALTTLHKHVNHYWEEHARTWVWEVMESLTLLQEKGFPIWIVSGTPTDILLPLERIIGANVIVGMDFEVVEGRITGKHSGIPCAGEGKARKLNAMLGQRKVRFCAGNGSLDGPMMELSEMAWSVYPAPDFAEYSRKKGWPILPRPADFVEEEKFLLED
ncbi:MAG: haloacid dehalogenase-like hydrolase [Deltaproteobacteria bacterium]|nr:haloacid dehalogenase-like hydrolase [Deltaproteobacteria bacterium]